MNDSHRQLASFTTPFAKTAEQNVFLSPHFDDICFSLGSLVSRLRAGRILTLFSGSENIGDRKLNFAIRGNSPLSVAESRYVVKIVSRLRLVEEHEFCTSVSVKLMVGGLLEAPLRGHHPFHDSLQRVDEQTRILAQGILRSMGKIVDGKSITVRPWLFCPIGIGEHLDHLVVYNTIRQNIDMMRARYRLAFYEDLPYAAKQPDRERRLRAFREDYKDFVRLYWLVDDAQKKLEHINIYKSQHIAAPKNLDGFSPHLGRPASAHEAVWVSPDDRE